MKIHLISLGCPKNLVDSEYILGTLGASGCDIAVDPLDADVLIINTCGFLSLSIDETRSEIEKACQIAVENGSRLYIYGCAVNRCQKMLVDEFPAVHGWFRTTERSALLQTISQRSIPETSRLVTTKGFAYLKIADGCSNNCSYCTIPIIRGPVHSIPEKTIITEARQLAAMGIRELILVAQDTTRYGHDLDDTSSLESLLKSCTAVPGIDWIRILYAHPRGVTTTLLHQIQDNDKVCAYIDVPIQHINDRILTMMNRQVTRTTIENLFERLKENNRGISIRTSVIVGFPTETDEEFMELYTFLERAGIDWLGVFTYNKEIGTKAALFEQVPSKLKTERYEKLISLQQSILECRYRKQNNTVEKVLVHGFDRFFIGHTERSCPDIDDPIKVIGNDLVPGRYYTAKITWSVNTMPCAKVISETP